jgi:predicted nucleic acid-binding protein
MRVYLDACCLNRLTDDQRQPRIRREAESIEQIFGRIQQGTIQWISSEALVEETNRNPRPERRLYIVSLLELASETISVDDAVVARARKLRAAGYGVFDALHLACAEASQADVLLTTDDKFVKRAAREDGSPAVPVRNPLSWSQEVFT